MKDIWNKRTTDLTFGDTVKIQLAAAGIAAGVMAAYVGAVVAVEKISEKRAVKKNNRQNDIIDTTCDED